MKMKTKSNKPYFFGQIAGTLVRSFIAAFVLFFATTPVYAADCTSNDEPRANAGSDLSVFASESATLVGSATGSDKLTYSWTCNGGRLENATSNEAEFTAPEVSQDTYYVCTLKAENSCGSNTDTVNVLVKTNPAQTTDETNLAALSADPNNGCAPLENVSLSAKINPQDNLQDYTYYFYCNGNVDQNLTITTKDTSYTAKSLCAYPETGTYTAYVRIVSGDLIDIKQSATISVKSCDNNSEGKIAVEKLVSNLSSGTGFTSSVSADPGDEISFKITVKALSGDLQELMLTDIPPEGIDNIQNLAVDGEPLSGDLKLGIGLGNIYEGSALSITYSAKILASDRFPGGQTRLTNTAKAQCSDNSCLSEGSAEITVSKGQTKVLTTAKTGFGDNPFTDSFVIPAGLSLLIVWAFRAQLIRFEEWTDARKKNYFVYKSKKLLDLKRARLKAEKLADKWA